MNERQRSGNRCSTRQHLDNRQRQGGQLEGVVVSLLQWRHHPFLFLETVLTGRGRVDHRAHPHVRIIVSVKCIVL